MTKFNFVAINFSKNMVIASQKRDLEKTRLKRHIIFRHIYLQSDNYPYNLENNATLITMRPPI